MDFNNNIFKTEEVRLASGRIVWFIVKVETGERICNVTSQEDLDWTINELMQQRLAEVNSRLATGK